ncbi:MAG: hypothetical protein IPO27_14455 [Bacteroidetes bacterium]|nr:hypothetical protein [Bacteroidota bacterium]
MSNKNQINSRDYISRSYIRDNKIKFFTVTLDVIFGIVLVGLCVFLMSMTAYAQNVGINNSAPHTKSLLDLTSNDKGLLTPRMTEVQRTSMFAVSDVSAKGMLVYQTDNTQGFYFYDGAAWNFMGSSNSGWSTLGNAGTTSATNFIGTTDAQDFVVKTNNYENMRMTAAGNVGLGTSTPTAKLHINSNSVTGTQNLKITEFLNDWARIGFYNDSSVKFWEIAAKPNNVDSLSSYNVFHSSAGNLLSLLGNGRMGIANSAPIAPLSFNNGIGQKITFWNVGTASYGIGLQGALLQMHTASINDDIAFGHGNSGALVETVRFKGNGKVGFGTKTPGAFLNKARVEIADDDGSNSDLLMSTGGTFGYPQLVFHKSRGTAAVPTIAANGDWAGTIVGRCYNGLNFENSAAIIFGVDSAVSAGKVRGSISFHTSGGAQAEKMRVTKDGNVGIGNVNPVTKLYVQNNDSNYTTALLINTHTSGYSGMWFASTNGSLQGHFGYANSLAPNWANKVYAGSISAVPFLLTTSDLERMRIEADGDIGIGTTTPTARLHVYSNSATGAQNIKAHEVGSDLARIGMYNDSTTKFWEVAALPHNIDSLSVVHIYNSSAGNLLSVKGNGRVGIANSNPIAPLSFNSTLGQKITLWNNATSSYGIGVLPSLLQIHTANVNDDIAFGYGSSSSFTEHARIKGNGNIGMGIINPTARLHIYSNSATGTQNIKVQETANDFARIGMYNDSTTKFWEIAAQPNAVDSLARFNVYNSSTGALLTVTGDGNVGIKSANPTAELEVNGFTKLGTDAPAIKMKKFTGTTSATQGGAIFFAHGMNSAKIVDIGVVIEYSAGSFVTINYNLTVGFESGVYYTATHVFLGNVNGNSANILSKPYKLVITYEE